MKGKRSSNGSSAAELKKTPKMSTASSSAFQAGRHCLFCEKRLDHCEIEMLEGNGKMEICSRFYSQLIRDKTSNIRINEESEIQQVLRKSGCCAECFGMVEDHVKSNEQIEQQKLLLRFNLDRIKMALERERAGNEPSKPNATLDNVPENSVTSTQASDHADVNVIRQKILDACLKTLKKKNPKVVVKPLRNLSAVAAEEDVRDNISEDDGASLEDESLESVLDEAESSASPPEPEPGLEDEDGQVVVKTECPDGVVRCASPTESLRSMIRKGAVPVEGVTSSLYFYKKLAPQSDEDEEPPSHFGNEIFSMEMDQDVGIDNAPPIKRGRGRPPRVQNKKDDGIPSRPCTVGSRGEMPPPPPPPPAVKRKRGRPPTRK